MTIASSMKPASVHWVLPLLTVAMALTGAMTPASAALMLGRHSQRAGFSTIIIINGSPNTLQDKEVTMAELFKSKGYGTAMAGKRNNHHEN